MIFYKNGRIKIKHFLVFFLIMSLLGCASTVKKSQEAVKESETAEQIPEKVIIEKVSYFNTSKSTTIIFKTSNRVDYTSYNLSAPDRIVVEFNNAILSPAAEEALPVNRGVVTGVTLNEGSGDEAKVTAEIELVEKAEAEIERGDTELKVTVKNPVIEEAVAEKEVAESGEEEKAKDIDAIKKALEEDLTKKNKVLSTELARDESDYEFGEKKFTGEPISLDLQNADVEDVIRLIAEISGMNFVIEEGVRGKVNLKLDKIPWDQALDLILKINTPQLVLIKEQGIYRIMTLSKSKQIRKEKAEEAQARKEEKEAREAVLPLVTKTIRLSYAKAEEIEPLVKKFMSSRVKTDALLTVDDRTNSLIIKDIVPTVEQIEKVIAQLDKPTPEVEIMAKIVEIEEGYDRALGIQWGADLTKSPATGNATGLQFPSNIKLSGTVADANNPSLSGRDFLVNLPVADKNTGIGLILGNVDNTFNLDVQLSALEKENRVRLLNNPKLLVVDNETAKIQVGDQLPQVTIDEQGKQSIEWKDVGIILEVTPQITADGSIFMEISLEKSRQGGNVQLTTGTHYSIVKTESETKVLIKSGETAVIGGLTEKSDDSSRSGTPFLSKIPILGSLFKNKVSNKSSKEILIFITPRILEQYM
ncbi:MAG: type IV pilus secretin family protein [Candidatus Schekmanbacteria bacterium]|nr:MAG: type IV pilus secretin family protein [Candidatus Schekmanbacteria bacterium]